MRKLLLVMKITTFLITVCIMQVSASSFAQKITLNQKGITIESLFREISKQTGYSVFYSDKKIDQNRKIDAHFKDTPLEEVLNISFKDQPVKFTISDQSVLIERKEPTFLERLANRWASIDANGRVVDSENRPLPGASVKVKKTGKGVSTDKDGRFFLRGVEEGAVLVVSFIGYLPKEVIASANMGSVVLEQSLSKLDEVQVIAYGTTTRRLSTGNISTVKAEDIEKQPVNNPLLALQGRVPGVFIEQSTGIAGGGVKVRIQGQNSILNGNDPLYVIDGIPYISQLLPSDGSPIYGQLHGGSPMSFINPADIESIDILKDADATAIYGSRAANGAVLITTKKGKAGEIKVDVNLQSGFGKVGKQLNLLNTQQYLQMRHEALRNDHLPVSPTDYDINGQWDTTRYTNWQKELIGGTSKYQDFQGTVSGGSATTTFLFGVGYHKETTVFPGDFADTKGSAKLSIGSSSKNQKFKIQVGLNYLIDNNHLPNDDLTDVAIQSAPNSPTLYNNDGSLNWSPDNEGNSTFNNPLARLYIRYKNKTTNLMSNVYLSYQVLPGLEIKSSMGYTNLQTNDLNTIPQSSYAPELWIYNGRLAIWGNNNINSWNIEPQLTYTRQIAKGKLDLLVGTTFQQRNSHSLGLQGSQQISDAVLDDFKSALVVNVGSTLEEIYKYSALFGRLNYIWNDKYILNINARRDGSSRFGSANQFHDFGSIAGGWIFSEESFWKNNLNFLSFGKLKVSYGTTGNDQIGEYRYLSLYNSINKTKPYQGTLGLKPQNITNPTIAWEETKKLQGGIDLGFFKDKLILNATYSFNQSSNQLVGYPLPGFAGFTSVLLNLPAKVQNSGWEFSLSTINLVSKNFEWKSGFNLTIQRNKLADFAGLEQSSYANDYIIGKPVSVQRLFHSLGVNATTGVYQFADKNGNITNSPSYGDRTVFVDASPMFYGGLYNSFKYKGFDLDILFQFVKQKSLGNQFGINFPGAGISYGNQPISVLSRWQKPGDQTNVQRFNTDYSLLEPYGDVQSSDANWVDASYVRLKNLSISWQLPKHIKNIVHLENCKLYLQGQNLFTITKYSGLDPESKSLFSILPPLRVITFGAKISI
ncbi:SusC/RagA family TonB-linked outer membrane protein [Pedobacter nutrimenti]|uniref:SusC/RagA family TonB-linked outer membrane protein n=1 Tax=Pedobacter nutrimenti TaxID=1241337 RepID=UPI0029316C23|nr:SusC/RagA family TonB-linked outer membrane protein [Pedobacter nutrimenti]